MSKLNFTAAATFAAFAAGMVPAHAADKGSEATPAVKSQAWTQFGYAPTGSRFNANETHLSVKNVAKLKLAWTANIGGLIESSPTIFGEVVYIGSGQFNNAVYALNAKTGKKIWSFPTGGFIGGAPVVTANRVFIDGDGGVLYAINRQTGKQVWAATASSYDFQSMLLIGDSLFTANGTAYSATSGKLLWKSSYVGQSSTPTYDNGIVYYNCGDAAAGLDAKTGATVFKAGEMITDCFGGTPELPIAGNLLLAPGLSESELVALNKKTGSQVWSAVASGCCSSPAVANGLVYVAANTQLYAFRLSNGKLVWTAPTQGTIEGSPAVANGVVYIGSGDNFLYAFNAVSGKRLFQFKTGDKIISSPSVSNGYVYIGSDDGKVRAFTAP